MAKADDMVTCLALLRVHLFLKLAAYCQPVVGFPAKFVRGPLQVSKHWR